MRNLLAFIGGGVITFLGLGWYLDWYRIAKQPAPAGYQRWQVDIDPKKIGDDAHKAIDRGSEIVDHLRDKQQDPAAPKPDAPQLPAALPGPQRPAMNPIIPQGGIFQGAPQPVPMPVIPAANWQPLDPK